MDQVAISHPGEVVDYSRALAALPTAQRLLCLIPGAHMVGVGTKITKGQHSDEPALMVFVRQKRPLAELEASHIIPSTIEGVRTDVVQAAPPKRLSGPDDSNYKTIRGGIQIEPGGLTEGRSTETIGSFPRVIPGYGLGGLGTIGFFVRVNNPQPSVHAVTNWHIVGEPMRGSPTNVNPTRGAGANQHNWLIDADPTKAITADTLFVAEITMVYNHALTRLAAFHRSSEGETVSVTVNALVTVINSMGHDLNATANGNNSVRVATNAPTTLAVSRIIAFGPPSPNPNSKLTASVKNTTITFSGHAEDASGAYITVNVGGTTATSGGMALIPTDMTLPFLAQEVVQVIERLGLSGVTATATGATVTVTGAQHVAVDFSGDIRVGQPTNEFHTSRCLRCCDKRIGMVSFARLDLDLALIQLDGGLVFHADIEDVGAIAGTVDVTTLPPGAPLWKRGRTTQLTKGTLVAHGARPLYGDDFIEFDDTADPPQWRLFNRHFTNAIVVQGPTGEVFSAGGDSGAALVTPPVTAADGSKTTRVVGLLFGSNEPDFQQPDQRQSAFASSITDILTRLKSSAGFGVDVTLVTAAKEGVDQTAPAGATEPAVSPAVNAMARVGHRDVTPAGAQLARLSAAERAIAATPGGQLYGPIISRHLAEAQQLVNTNKRMATVWHRNGGPAIIDGLMRMLLIADQRIPQEINGMPVTRCLEQIASAFARYGSASFAADIAEHAHAIVAMAGGTFSELLAALEAVVVPPTAAQA